MKQKTIQQAFDKPAHLTDMKTVHTQYKEVRQRLAPAWPPLLTHEQLVDWLIYHVPLKDNGSLWAPFSVSYKMPRRALVWDIYIMAETPWKAYSDLATEIKKYGQLHQEITDLYWYWTIE